ncbi:AfsA-related hotdog domain-containing protein [Neisseriaceae bacterium CLB008]
MNMKRAVFGDRFKHYAHVVDGVTLSELLAALQEETIQEEAYEVCQGINPEALNRLRQGFSALGKSDQLTYPAHHEPLDRLWVHKTQQCNVLISPPRALASAQFEMNLVVDDANELMLDHLSGFHVQGMVLIEAARQAFLAVTECHLLAKNIQYYFILERLEVTYEAFVFPMYCGILFQLTGQHQWDHKHGYEADIQFWQNGSLCTRIQVQYSVYEATRLLNKEQGLAISARQRQAHAPALATATGVFDR